MEWGGRTGGRCPGGRGGWGGRLRTAALVCSTCAVSFLGSDSLRDGSVGRPRPLGRRQWPAGLLVSLSPPTDRPRVPYLCCASLLQPAHLVAWRPLAAAAGAAGSLGHAPRNPSEITETVAVWAALASLAARRSTPGLLRLHCCSRPSSCPCSAQDVAPSRPSAICGRRTPESALCAPAMARPTTGHFQSIPSEPHVMESVTARLRGHPQNAAYACGV